MRTLVAAIAVVILQTPSGAQPSAQSAAPPCAVRGSQHWLSTRPSPLDSATLTVGGAIARICHSRPSLRGRAVP